jgi:outer membrane protein OmpA-like peptidoglycan-associated protein
MMLKKVVHGASALCLLAPFAGAQAAASGSVSADTTAPAPAADASVSTTAAEPAAPALEESPDAEPELPPVPPEGEPEAAAEPPPEAAPATAPADGKVPYMQRYKPEAMTWEVGLFGGVFLPSAGILLYSTQLPYQAYNGAALELGGRLAFFPLTFLGVEAEFMLADGNVPADLTDVDPRLVSNNAIFTSYRGQLVGQLPFWSVVPFVTVGVSALGATSQALGHDTSAAFHFGAGVKVPFSKTFSLRADFRENMMGRSNDSFGGISFSEEVLLGATFTLGRKQAEAAPVAPADRDHDTVADYADVCPDSPALTPDGCPLDTDQDGLSDPEDHCPREPAATENGCPDPDKDKDGVPVPCDQCPDELGAPGDGCPIRDADGDGILDDIDACPKEAETKNGFEDDDGCPDEVPKEVEKFTGAIQGITFVAGSPKIQKGSDRTLQAAADILIKYPSIKLEITGHTSSEGKAEVNQKLSEDRADAVRDWLIDHGVPTDRVTSRGVGSDQPVADNNTQAGRSKNRRIEFSIMPETTTPAADKPAAE